MTSVGSTSASFVLPPIPTTTTLLIPSAIKKRITFLSLPMNIQKIFAANCGVQDLQKITDANQYFAKEVYDGRIWKIVARSLGLPEKIDMTAEMQIEEYYKSVNTFILSKLPDTTRKKLLSGTTETQIALYAALEKELPTIKFDVADKNYITSRMDDMSRNPSMAELEGLQVLIRCDLIDFKKLSFQDYLETQLMPFVKSAVFPPQIEKIFQMLILKFGANHRFFQIFLLECNALNNHKSFELLLNIGIKANSETLEELIDTLFFKALCLTQNYEILKILLNRCNTDEFTQLKTRFIAWKSYVDFLDDKLEKMRPNANLDDILTLAPAVQSLWKVENDLRNLFKESENKIKMEADTKNTASTALFGAATAAVSSISISSLKPIDQYLSLQQLLRSSAGVIPNVPGNIMVFQILLNYYLSPENMFSASARNAFLPQLLTENSRHFNPLNMQVHNLLIDLGVQPSLNALVACADWNTFTNLTITPFWQKTLSAASAQVRKDLVIRFLEPFIYYTQITKLLLDAATIEDDVKTKNTLEGYLKDVQEEASQLVNEILGDTPRNEKLDDLNSYLNARWEITNIISHMSPRRQEQLLHWGAALDNPDMIHIFGPVVHAQARSNVIEEWQKSGSSEKYLQIFLGQVKQDLQISYSHSKWLVDHAFLGGLLNDNALVKPFEVLLPHLNEQSCKSLLRHIHYIGDLLINVIGGVGSTIEQSLKSEAADKDHPSIWILNRCKSLSLLVIHALNGIEKSKGLALTTLGKGANIRSNRVSAFTSPGLILKWVFQNYGIASAYYRTVYAKIAQDMPDKLPSFLIPILQSGAKVTLIELQDNIQIILSASVKEQEKDRALQMLLLKLRFGKDAHAQFFKWLHELEQNSLALAQREIELNMKDDKSVGESRAKKERLIALWTKIHSALASSRR